MSSSEERIVIKFDDHGEKKFVTAMVMGSLKKSDRQPPAEKKGSRKKKSRARRGCSGGQFEELSLNARQKRLFEEARKRNPDLKMPTDAKPAVGVDRSRSGPDQAGGRRQEQPARASGVRSAAKAAKRLPANRPASVVTYFEAKGFGFLRPGRRRHGISSSTSRAWSKGWPPICGPARACSTSWAWTAPAKWRPAASASRRRNEPSAFSHQLSACAR